MGLPYNLSVGKQQTQTSMNSENTQARLRLIKANHRGASALSHLQDTVELEMPAPTHPRSDEEVDNHRMAQAARLLELTSDLAQVPNELPLRRINYGNIRRSMTVPATADSRQLYVVELNVQFAVPGSEGAHNVLVQDRTGWYGVQASYEDVLADRTTGPKLTPTTPSYSCNVEIL